MSKNSKYAQKSAHAIPVHYSESIAVAEPARDGETGHVVYPEIVRFVIVLLMASAVCLDSSFLADRHGEQAAL